MHTLQTIPHLFASAPRHLVHSAGGGFLRLAVRVHRGEQGQLSILSLVVILGMLLSLATVTNVAQVMKQKLETQNAADGITQATSTHMARGLNAITTANHLIGEFQALVVLHHALGGDALDSGNQNERTPRDVQQSVRNCYDLARTWCFDVPRWLKPQDFQYKMVSRKVVVDASILDSKVHLKKVMSYAYVAHAVGGMYYKLRYLPYIGKAGEALGITIMVCSLTFESKVYLEWLIVELFETFARTPLSPLKKLLQRAAIPAVHLYARGQTIATPLRAEKTAAEIGEFHLADGSLFPGLQKNTSLPLLQLPVESEPRRMNDTEIQKSQLVRASVPWIHHWRLPLLKFGEDSLQLARFKSFYVRHTQEMALELARRAKEKQGVNLLILKGLTEVQMEKGKESWNFANGSREADRLFCLMGFAHRQEPPMTAPAFFDPVNSAGVACFAQAMTYNANPQKKAVSPVRQAEAGWDTLNWVGGTMPEWRLGADPNPKGKTPVGYFAARSPEPRIRVNWQTMLVPATRVAESVRWQRSSLGDIMRRTEVSRAISRTH